MKSKPSASRAALIIVAVLIAGVLVWIFRPVFFRETPSQDIQTSTAKTKRSSSQSDSIPDPTSGTVVQESGKQSKRPNDFRMSTEDSFASVSDDNFFTTTGVSDLIPEGAVNNFIVGQRVYAFAAIHANRKETVRITWFDSDNNEIPPSAYLDVEPNEGPIGFRAYTYRIFRQQGSYHVAIYNSAGVMAARSSFIVTDQIK